MSIVAIVKELAFRLKLMVLGVRFYEAHEAEGEVIYKCSQQLTADVAVEFHFRMVKCSDFLLKRGELILEHYPSYTITPVFTQSIPQGLEHANNRTFFFNGKYNDFGLDVDRTIQLIADIYIDFMLKKLD